MAELIANSTPDLVECSGSIRDVSLWPVKPVYLHPLLEPNPDFETMAARPSSVSGPATRAPWLRNPRKGASRRLLA